MTKRIAISTHCVALIVALTATTTFASIVSVMGPPSSAGTAPAILAAAPLVVLDSMATNTGQQGFNEMQNVLLAMDLAVDGGIITAGTWVSSQMIFLNQELDTANGLLTHEGVVWTFDGLVLGVMSDEMGTLEDDSTGILGAPGTVYGGPSDNRGLEGDDTYVVFGNTVNVSLFVRQPGDWIRVVTAAVVPEPTTFLVWGVLGFCAAAGTWRRQ